jgi:hydrogenase expression/formation protein HypC
MRIISIEGDEAVAEVEGVKRTVQLNLIDNIRVGDYVLVHAGFAIEKMDATAAQESIKLRKDYGISTL